MLQTKIDTVGMDFELDEKINNKNLLKEAFNHLSLKDKLSFNMLVRKNAKFWDKSRKSVGQAFNSKDHLKMEGSKANECGSDVNDKDVSSNQSLPNDSIPNCIFQNEHDDDLISCISDNDRASLNVAMSLMNEEELADLEQSIDLSDMKKWLLERSYESLKDAYIKTRQSLHTLTEKGSGLVSPKVNGAAEDTSSLHSDKSIMLSNQRNLSQAFASLVMRKNLLKSQKQVSDVSPNKDEEGETEKKSMQTN